MGAGRLRGWERKGVACPSLREGRRVFFSFTDLVVLRAAQMLSDKGRDPAHYLHMLDTLQLRMLEFDDTRERKMITASADRVILSRRNHFIDRANGQVLVRIDLDELVQSLDVRFGKNGARKSADEWAEEGARYAASSKTVHLAIAAYKEAIKVDPTRVDCYLAIGKLFYRQRNLVDAERSFRMAILRGPYNAAAHVNLGRVMEELNCLDEAMVCYEKALSSDPNLPEAHFRMACASEKADMTERAIRYFQSYLQLALEEPKAIRVRKKLAELLAEATT